MTSKITTVVDDDGAVWQGAEVDTSTPLMDAALFFVTGGASALLAAAPDTGHRTVVVNGQEHYGRKA